MCNRCGFEECACLGGNIITKLRELCEHHGISTASASPEELIERIGRQLTILKRDIQRAKTYGQDPSGRWG